MSDNHDDLENLFNEFFNNSDSTPLPEPTPDQIRLEAMTATELHIQAFTEASERGGDSYHEMLSSWMEEFAYYLPVLEDFEEYEQCQKVFDTMKAIREDGNNIKLNKSLEDLKVTVVHEDMDTENDDIDEPDF